MDGHVAEWLRSGLQILYSAFCSVWPCAAECQFTGINPRQHVALSGPVGLRSVSFGSNFGSNSDPFRSPEPERDYALTPPLPAAVVSRGPATWILRLQCACRINSLPGRKWRNGRSAWTTNKFRTRPGQGHSLIRTPGRLREKRLAKVTPNIRAIYGGLVGAICGLRSPL